MSKQGGITVGLLKSLCDCQPENFALVLFLSVEQLYLYVKGLYSVMGSKGKIASFESAGRNTLLTSLLLLETGFSAAVQSDASVLEDMLLHNRVRTAGNAPSLAQQYSSFRSIGGGELDRTLAYTLVSSLLLLLHAPGVTIPYAHGHNVPNIFESLSEYSGGLKEICRGAVWGRSGEGVKERTYRFRIMRVCIATLLPPCIHSAVIKREVRPGVYESPPAGQDRSFAYHHNAQHCQSIMYRLWTELSLPGSPLPHRAALFTSLLNVLAGTVQEGYFSEEAAMCSYIDACSHLFLLLFQRSRFLRGLGESGNGTLISLDEVQKHDFFRSTLREFSRRVKEVKFLLEGLEAGLTAHRLHAVKPMGFSLATVLGGYRKPLPRYAPAETLLALYTLAEASTEVRLALTTERPERLLHTLLHFVSCILSEDLPSQRAAKRQNVTTTTALSLITMLCSELTWGALFHSTPPWGEELLQRVGSGCINAQTAGEVTFAVLYAVLRSDISWGVRVGALHCLRSTTPFVCTPAPFICTGLSTLLENSISSDTPELLLDIVLCTLRFSEGKGVRLLAHLIGEEVFGVVVKLKEGAAGAEVAEKVEPLWGVLVHFRQAYRERHGGAGKDGGATLQGDAVLWINTYLALEGSADTMLTRFLATMPPFEPETTHTPMQYALQDRSVWRLLLDPVHMPSVCEVV